MDFNKSDILNTAWNQLFTYIQTVEYAKSILVTDIPTQQEYNTFWLSKTTEWI